MKRRLGLIVIALIPIAVLVVGAAGSGLLVDWLWFDTLGFGAVFATTWSCKALAFGVAAVLTAAWLAANGLVAAGGTAPPRVRRLRVIRGNGSSQGLPELFDVSLDHLPWRTLVLLGAVLLGMLVGLAQATNWEAFLRWRYAVPFGRTEPIFGQDLGFYVFTLPVYGIIRDWALLIVVLAAAISGGVYWARGAIDVDEGLPKIAPAAIRHLSVLLAIFFLIKAADYVLQRYDLLLSDNSIVFGAAYTDVHVRLPMLVGLVALSLLAAVLCAANSFVQDVRLPVAAVVLLLGGALLEGIIPGVFQTYRVKPDELRLESPYITESIRFTQYGYGLDRFSSRPFPANGQLTPAVLAANQGTIQNIRWWDPRPLLETYRQLQEIRLYYDFHDVDVDRYNLNGTYQQVLLSARELNQSRLPSDAQTWINQHFKFTHGIGVTMSPVNRFDEEGLPLFHIKDIPPVSSVGLRIDRPELYYGELPSNYVVVGGTTKEFDYPKGQDNVYTTYQGRGGVSLQGMWRRLLFAWYLGDIKLLISDNVTPTSQILFRRAIQDRIRRVAPFLRLDRDPYLVIDNGRLVWLQDAYTVSDALPYSQRNPPSGINYIRNAVKIATDAYDGTLHFYVFEPNDPVVQAYQRIFPSLFEPLDHMPPSLRQHIRYPEDLFILQAKLYGTYHMKDPEVFYNKEDLWSFPQESFGGQTVTMQPYYSIMRLPGEVSEEFILMLPMVPNNRDNMIAWLAARCDGAHYGSVVEFAFPKEKLIYGPAQIEARIDQDTTISQQLSLWNQTGSRVIRGNLLVIPIEDTLLYVEPLYLSAEKRELPELKRLIASYGDRVAMSQKIEPLLASLFASPATAPVVSASPPPVAPTAPVLGNAPSSEALTHYRQALQALRNNDWRTFGTEMDALQKALEGAAPPPS